MRDPHRVRIRYLSRVDGSFGAYSSDKLKSLPLTMKPLHEERRPGAEEMGADQGGPYLKIWQMVIVICMGFGRRSKSFALGGVWT